MGIDKKGLKSIQFYFSALKFDEISPKPSQSQGKLPGVNTALLPQTTNVTIIKSIFITYQLQRDLSQRTSTHLKRSFKSDPTAVNVWFHQLLRWGSLSNHKQLLCWDILNRWSFKGEPCTFNLIKDLKFKSYQLYLCVCVILTKLCVKRWFCIIIKLLLY